MNHDRPTGRQMAMTLAAWVIGLLVMGGVIFAASSALMPKTSPTTLPVSSRLSSLATASVEATVATPAPAVPVAAPASVPASVQAAVPPKPKPTSKKTPPPVKTPASPFGGKVVVIDAGHQGKGDSSLEPIGPGSSTRKPKVASGATGIATHNTESSVNLQIALKLQKNLVRAGVKVVMIRTTQNVNIANSKRAKIANAAHAALFIRIHCDGSTNRSQYGLSTLVPGANQWTGPIVDRSGRAGGYVHRAVLAASGARDLGVKKRSDLSGFNWSTVPTILVELGFLSNPAEDRKLGTSAYQATLAKGLATGIEAYLKTK